MRRKQFSNLPLLDKSMTRAAFLQRCSLLTTISLWTWSSRAGYISAQENVNIPQWIKTDDGKEWLLCYGWQWIPTLKQGSDTACAPTVCEMLRQFIKRYHQHRLHIDLQLPGYDDIWRGLKTSTIAKELNWNGGFVAARTMVLYWNERIAPKASGWLVKQHCANSVEALLAAMDQSRMPAVVTCLMPYRGAKVLNAIRMPLGIVSGGLSEIVYRCKMPFKLPDETILNSYLHAMCLCGAMRETNNPQNVDLIFVDPWIGGYRVWNAAEFGNWFLNYDAVGNHRFAQETKESFIKLAPPGTFLLLEKHV